MTGIAQRATRASAAAGATILIGMALSGLNRSQGTSPDQQPNVGPVKRGPLAGNGPGVGTGTGPQGARDDHDVVAPDAPGRGADKPSDIPPKGWWQILKRTGNAVMQDGLLAQAAAMTFYSLLALFPALAMLVSLYGLIADPRTLSDTISGIKGVVPGGGMDIITGQLKSLASSPHKALGLGLAIGLATSLWSATSGIKALFSALNVAYNENETRSFIRLTVIAMIFTIGSILFLMVAIGGVVALPAILSFVGIGSGAKLVLDLVRWPVLLVGLGVFLSLVYRYGPCRAKARWRWVTWGSAAATIGWLIVSVAFSYYTAHFGSYNKTYGTLGAAVGFMTWLWLSATVVLVGAELDAEMEHQTAKDTTEGPEKPMGSRGADAADRVAA
ncbi:YihY/virulence factor BrkB family protein [Acidisoma sp.]|uniref:YihY/virulence factor BrkB family protein n=1 Tax=Acidisoma sp. TaxID=1872115 RepID=UPI003B00DD86